MSGRNYPTTTPDWQAAVRRRTRFYLLVSLLLAILFGLLVYDFYTDREQIEPRDLIPVIFAARDLPAGASLEKNSLEVREVPRRSVPLEHFTFKEQVLGQKTLYPLAEGEVVLPGKLAGAGGGAVAKRCPPGKWCLSIPLEWFIAPPPDLAVGDTVEIASARPGLAPEQTGYLATRVQVVYLLLESSPPAIVFSLDDQEALLLLYARANEYQLLVLLRPGGS